MFETVLFPIERRNQGLDGAAEAIALAQDHAAGLVLLPVLEPGEGASGPMWLTQAQLLQQTQARVERCGLPCEVLERQGSSAAEICALATELNVDVIVMGLRGLNPDQDQDSTVCRVIQHAPCPVLVVP